MRIAVLATNRNPLVEPYAGGQESLTAALARGFRQRGHHVVLFAAAGTDASLADELLTYPPLPRLSAVAQLDPQLPEPPFLEDHHAFTFAVSQLAGRDDIDVIANHSLHHLPLSLSSLLTPPLVTTLHTPPFPWLELGAALAVDSARYVAVSQAVADAWETLDSTVIHNGVDAEAFAPRVTNRLASHDPSQVPGFASQVPSQVCRYVAWVGRITPEKAPHLAIEAAQRAGVALRFAGPISDPAYFGERIEPLLQDDNESSAVHYLGPLGGSQVADLMGGADAVLVTPVWDEPFGLVAIEAAMCGAAVVGLRRGGLSEAVIAETGVLVEDPGNDRVRVERLADALRGVVSARRSGTSQRWNPHSVRAAAAEAFGLDRCVREHERVLQEAVRDATDR